MTINIEFMMQLTGSLLTLAIVLFVIGSSFYVPNALEDISKLNKRVGELEKKLGKEE